MKKLLFLCIALFLFANEAILKLDTKGHTGLIRDIIVAKNGDIISASNDKTIRVWGSDGKEKRKILGEIGAGPNGKIFAIALSPNEKYLVVGGYLGNDINHWGNIRIYDYKSGKLIKLLKSHTNVVIGLAFSSNGKYLISGSADKTAKIWDMDSFTLLDTIKTHTRAVYAVKIIKNRYAITAGWDGNIDMYDMQNHYTIKSHHLNDSLQYLAINRVKRQIAVCGYNNQINIYDYNLNHIKTIYGNHKLIGLNYSKDGKYLIVGAGSDPHNVNIYETNNYFLYSLFNKFHNYTQSVDFINDKLAVSGGGNNNEIYIWNFHTEKVIKKIVGVGSRVLEVAINGDNILYLTEKNNKYIEKHINLKNFKIKNIPNKKLLSNFKMIKKVNGNYSLSVSKTPPYGYATILNIFYNGKIINRIIKSSYNGYEHRCYGWYKNYIISGGNNGHLIIYNTEGREVANLVGHVGTIWSIALDGDILVSGSDDQTIKLWDLSKIGKQKVIYPTLTLFISKDNEYVAYTPQGFFTSSKKGSQYVGYWINRGYDKEAKYLTVDKFYNSFYRPDLIAKALKGENLDKYAKNINIDKLLSTGFAPKVKILTHSYKSNKRDITLKLQVCDNGGGYNNMTLYLNGMAIDVIDNDRALKITHHKRKSKCFEFDKLISLQNGKNIIGFKATNKSGYIESNLDKITINYKGKLKKPNLYILAIAIDKYRDGDLWLKYSKADAKAFLQEIKKVSKPLFKHIYTYTLFDKDVTKSQIIQTFSEIGKQTNRNDVFILYLAGHGITDPKTGSYFYLPVDFRYKNEESIQKQGFSQKDFKLALSKIQAMKSLAILDTCNSGSFAEAMASRGILQKTAINKLTRATGRATLVASSKDQVALEGYKGHGVFTYTLLQALNGAGYGRDNKITIKELAGYVEDVLPDLTYQKWGYEQIPQSTITGNDFPIGVK